MIGAVLALMVLGYLIFLIDWKDLRSILGVGGWATACFLIVVTILIVSVIVSPGTTPPAGYN